MTDINRQFEAVRKLRLEVNVDYVGQLLSNQPIPVLKKSGFNLKFFMSVLIGAAAIVFLLNTKMQEYTGDKPLKLHSAAGLALDTAKKDNSNQLEIQSLTDKNDGQGTQIVGDTNGFKLKPTFPIDTSRFVRVSSARDSNFLKSSESLSVSGGPQDLQMQHFDFINSLFHLSDSVEGSMPGTQYQFTIRKEESEREIFQKLKEVYHLGMTVFMNKCKERRGDIYHLKLSFSYTTVDCRQHFFYNVDLKGFDTFSFGWDTSNNGSIEHFWTQLNNGKKSFIHDVYTHKGKFKYSHKD
ncbi:MAG: hypothetical protein GC193_02445 [Cryomorphaceae bacterium]|nr:hypothetical protein [Cryomorphaceae bacterium]